MNRSIALNSALARPEMVTALVVAGTGAGPDETGGGSRRSTPSPARRCRSRSSPGTSPGSGGPTVHPLLLHDPPCSRPRAHGLGSPGQGHHRLLAGAAASRPRGAHTPDRRRARRAVREGPPLHGRHASRRPPRPDPGVGHLTKLEAPHAFNRGQGVARRGSAPPDSRGETAPSLRRCPVRTPTANGVATYWAQEGDRPRPHADLRAGPRPARDLVRTTRSTAASAPARATSIQSHRASRCRPVPEPAPTPTSGASPFSRSTTRPVDFRCASPTARSMTCTRPRASSSSTCAT